MFSPKLAQSSGDIFKGNSSMSRKVTPKNSFVSNNGEKKEFFASHQNPIRKSKSGLLITQGEVVKADPLIDVEYVEESKSSP